MLYRTYAWFVALDCAIDALRQWTIYCFTNKCSEIRNPLVRCGIMKHKHDASSAYIAEMVTVMEFGTRYTGAECPRFQLKTKWSGMAEAQNARDEKGGMLAT